MNTAAAASDTNSLTHTQAVESPVGPPTESPKHGASITTLRSQISGLQHSFKAKLSSSHHWTIYPACAGALISLIFTIHGWISGNSLLATAGIICTVTHAIFLYYSSEFRDLLNINKLKQQLDEQLIQINEQITDLHATLEQLENANDRLQKAANKWERDLHTANEKAEQQHARDLQNISDTNEQQQRLELQIQTLEDTRTSLTATLQGLNMTMDQLQIQLQEKIALNGELNTSKALLQRQCDSLHQTNERLALLVRTNDHAFRQTREASAHLHQQVEKLRALTPAVSPTSPADAAEVDARTPHVPRSRNVTPAPTAASFVFVPFVPPRSLSAPRDSPSPRQPPSDRTTSEPPIIRSLIP